MQSLRLFFPQENVCTTSQGNTPIWNKSHAHHKGRMQRLVSHPVNHLFRIADRCDFILMQDVYWYWKNNFWATPAMMCFANVLNCSVQNFEGGSHEMCEVIWEAMRQRRFYLGTATEWSDATRDAELHPFNEHEPEDLINAASLPAPLIEQFLARPSCFAREDMEAVRCAL